MYHQLHQETIEKLLAINDQPRRVYLALCWHAKIGEGTCFPGYLRLKKMTRISSGSEIYKAIQTLEENDLIVTWMEGNKRHYQVL